MKKKLLHTCFYIFSSTAFGAVPIVQCKNNVIVKDSDLVREGATEYNINCYFCDSGKYPAGKNNCAKCPGVGTNIDGKQSGILGCYQPSGAVLSDEAGTYETTANCMYSMDYELTPICQKMGLGYDAVNGCSGACKLMAANESDGYEPDWIYWWGDSFVENCEGGDGLYWTGGVYSNGKCYVCFEKLVKEYLPNDPMGSLMFNWYPVHR